MFLLLDLVSSRKFYVVHYLQSYFFDQDLHLAIEIFIEAIFDAVHKAAHFLLSPSEAVRLMFRWLSSHGSDTDVSAGDLDVSAPTATLGEGDPTVTERKTTFSNTLNTDARTCQDVITEFG